MRSIKFLFYLFSFAIVDNQLIGKGSFGSVYKANWRNNVVAVKALSGLPDKGPLVEVIITNKWDVLHVFIDITFQIRYLSRVKHPSIIGLFATCMKGQNIYLIMEFAEGGSLYNLLHCSRVKYTASHAMSWCRQCADVGKLLVFILRCKFNFFILLGRRLSPCNVTKAAHSPWP